MTTIQRMRERADRVARVVRRIIGVPDYETYVTHLAQCHPGQAPLSAEEFSRQALKDKYSRPGSRCC